MRTLLVVAALGLVCGCGKQRQPGDVHAFKRWPEARQVLETAGQAIRVEAFRLDPNQAAAGARPDTANASKPEGGAPAAAARIGGFEVTAGPVALSKDQDARLRRVLADRETYDFDLHKKCEFQPGVALRFDAGDKTADLLICFACDELGVTDAQGNISTASFTARKELVELAQELFPNDREIAALELLR